MGTGIVSILLHNLPYNGSWLYWISVALYCVNVLIFVLFAIISLVRYVVYRGLFSAMLRHPVQSLFLGKRSPTRYVQPTDPPRTQEPFRWV